MDKNTKRQPGDLILDRYLPDADEVTREQARQNLRRFGRALLRIAMRLAREKLRERDSPEQPGGAILPEAP